MKNRPYWDVRPNSKWELAFGFRDKGTGKSHIRFINSKEQREIALMKGAKHWAVMWMDKGDKQRTLSIWGGEAFGETETKKATKGDRARMGIGTG